MKNYLNSVVLLTCIVLVMLLGLYYLPPITIAGVELKKVDMLADIRVAQDTDVSQPIAIDTTELKLDTANLAIVSDTVAPVMDSVKISAKEEFYNNVIKVKKDTTAVGVAHIIDYADSTQRGMFPFYTALDAMKEDEHQYTHIAFFGDSFIEADILTADLRTLLQKEYGGCGVGFVPITSEVRFFRRSVVHDFKGWDSFAVTQKPYDKSLLGISGEYFVPTSNAYVEYKGQSKFGSLLDTCQVASIYYNIENPLEVVQRINGARRDTLFLSSGEGLQQHQAFEKIGKIRWNIPADSTAVFMGATLDGEGGITLDNFGQRGSSGYSLTQIPAQKLKDFNNYRPYDLIVLEYGLNVVAKNVNNYGYYKKGLTQVVKYLKQCFPQAGFLIVSVSDRNVKGADGEYHTMPEIKSFVKMQQELAKENNIAFWNLFEAMGGDDSMVDLVNAKPAKANLDYTHINFIGGKYLGKKLFEALKDGKEMFDKKEVYTDE